MSARRAVWEVARRELVERSRSRVLRISLVLLLILSVGGAIAAARLSGRTPTDDIGLVGARSVALEPAIRLQAKAAGRTVHLHQLADAAAASRAVRDGSIDVALLDGSRILVKTSRTAGRRPRRAGRGRGSGGARSPARLRAHSGAGAQRAGAAQRCRFEVLEPTPAQLRPQPGAGRRRRCSRCSSCWCSSARRWPRASPRRSPRASSSCCSRPSRRGACSPARSSASACSASLCCCIPGAAALAAGQPGRRRGIALGGARGDRAGPAVVRARLRLLQRGVRRGRRARLPPRGPEHRDRCRSTPC